MGHRPTALIVLAIAALVLPACAEPHVVAKSPLRRPQMSPETTALDVFFARVPYADEEANLALWQELDEQVISVETRRRLAENGLRVGVASGRLPVALERMLEISDSSGAHVAADAANLDATNLDAAAADDAIAFADATDVSNFTPDADAQVTGRHVQCLDGETCLLLANDRHLDELHVLLPSVDGLRGRRFTRAQGSFDVTPTRQPDGRVRLRLLPKIQHGQLASRFEAQDAFISLVPGQQSQTFGQLAVDVDLSAGDVLVVACDINRQGSLGHRLLTTEHDGERLQKVIAIRIAQTQHDPVVAALMSDDGDTGNASDAAF
jgi:hypothetical protein